MAFFLLAVFALLKTDPTWAASAPAPLRQTVPTLHALYLPLTQKNNTVSAAPAEVPVRQTVPSLHFLYLPLVDKSYVAPAPLWRFGVAKSQRSLLEYDPYGLVSMRFGWYVDFTVNANPPTPYGMEYMPTVRVKQLKLTGGGSSTECCVTCSYKTPHEYSVTPSIAQIQSVAASHPGMTWLIGNEMERTDWGSDAACDHQDEMLPELYAQAYHDLYAVIKTADPSAQIAIGGMVEFTDLRRQYLERVWNEYLTRYGENMPVDVWNIHLYILQEVRGSWGADIPAGFSENSGTLYTVSDNKDFTKVWSQIVALRTWMKAHGQQNKPLIITEYGINMPTYYPGFSAAEVRDAMMYPSFDNFLNTTDSNLGYPADDYRLVQRWNWWSMDADDGSCDGGAFYEYYGGSLFNSGLGPSTPPTNCNYPGLGLSTLGNYWRQYVQNLPLAAVKPYAP